MSSSRNSLFHESSSFKAQFTQFLANIGTYTIYVFPQENNFFPVTYYAVKKVYIVRYYKLTNGMFIYHLLSCWGDNDNCIIYKAKAR